ncbi:MAG: DUF3095 family protein [Candidatus Pacebacteria bacterium]|nr:DUF3095 family protein [Candidatus Paceibacterota bacterium]
MSSKNFFSTLPSEDLPLSELLSQPKNFTRVPDDWVLILTDIEKSSSHFAADHYQEINLVAVSSISIVLNVSKKHDILIPFIYGGDGATMIVPPEMAEECLGCLATLQQNSLTRFNMNLRVFSMPVKDVHDAGFPISIAKISVSPKYHQAVFIGPGISQAEKLMKLENRHALADNITALPIDLSGLECKWNALHPLRTGDEIICLIIEPSREKDASKVFAQTLEKLNEVYGSFIDRHPIRPDTLSPTTHLKTILHASYLRYGKTNLWYIIRHIFFLFWGEIRAITHDVYMYLFPPKTPRDLTTSSDTLKIDTTLKTIFAGSPEKQHLLRAWLDDQEKQGKLTYGISISQSAVMTCYIEESQQSHIRFIDGFGGGYTKASIMLKEKIKSVK